jgi:hypothetical protein
MNMSPRDGCYWAGMMFGIIVGVLGARVLGQSSVVGFIVGIAIGVGRVLASERMYTALTGSGDQDRKPPQTE